MDLLVKRHGERHPEELERQNQSGNNRKERVKQSCGATELSAPRTALIVFFNVTFLNTGFDVLYNYFLTRYTMIFTWPTLF